MLRALFEKTGKAIWISHLDLMRVFQRAFQRSDLHLTHTQGFNPRASVSIAMPMSVGMESQCELLDFELDGQEISCEEILNRLNDALIDGVRVLEVYVPQQKIKNLAYLQCELTLEYDGGVPNGAREGIEQLFARGSILVEKKGKNGISNQDIIPMIKQIQVKAGDAQTLTISAVVCCQNPSLNPMQLLAAIHCYAKEFAPDFSKCKRLEIFDAEHHAFR